MANTFQLKRSAVPAKVPTTGDLQLGELALNTHDGKLYTLRDNGTPAVVEIGGAGVTDGDKGDITVSSSGATWIINSGVVSTTELGGDITAAGKALLDDADVAAQRTTMGAAAVDQTTHVGTTAIALNRASAAQVLTGINGITFPAVQVASSDPNTLDDYEEGEWTPVVEGTTTAGTGTYVFRVGYYFKIGNVKFITGTAQWTAHTGTGNLRVSGLPFGVGHTMVGMMSYTTLTVSGTPYILFLDNQSYFEIRTRPSGGGSNSAVAMDTSATIEFTGWYR